MLGRGFWFDPGRGRWLPPGQPMPPPSATPPCADELTMQLGLPDAGCMAMSLRAVGQAVEIHASAVFDPFPGLVAWLEQLALGERPRLPIDIEGFWYVLHALPCGAPHLARLAVTTHFYDDKLPKDLVMDVALPRRELVRGIYEPLNSFWGSARFLAVCKREWHMWDDEEDGPFHAHQEAEAMRSPVVEAYLDGHTPD